MTHGLLFAGVPFDLDGALRWEPGRIQVDALTFRRGTGGMLTFRDPLPNRPHHQISVSAQSELGRLTLGGTFLFVGERRAEADFISLALGLTTNEAYSRFDFRARVALTRGLKAYVVTENLFDRQYEEVLGYPALGRSVRVGVSWDWNMK